MLETKTAFRYIFSKHNGQREASIMIFISVVISIVAIITASAIMNSLQKTQLDTIRNIESFDLIIEDTSLDKDKIKALTGCDVYAFDDISCIVQNLNSDKAQSLRLRVIDSSYFDNPRTTQSLFSLGKINDGLIISNSMTYNLNASLNDELKVTVLKKGKTATLAPFTFKTKVSALYTSSLSEFSSSTLFIDCSLFTDLTGTQGSKFGLFTSLNLKDIEKIIYQEDPDCKVTNYKEYNNALYSALVLEKTLMYVFVAFIFLIVFKGLKNSTRRLIQNKKNEIAILKSVGLKEKKIRSIFLKQGLYIIVFAELVGCILGKILINNITDVIAFIGKLYTKVTGSISVLSLIPFSASISIIEILIIFVMVLLFACIYIILGCSFIKKNSVVEIINNGSY